MSANEVLDVAVIGGSFAGLSAALPLARARRRVALIDHGVTRNRFAAASHGFLGQDGRAPDEIRRIGRGELQAYPTVTLLADEATGAEAVGNGFALATRSSGTLRARRLVLATGMRDVLPDVPGLPECWGRTAIQCPYCHGYEIADRPTGILMTGPGGLHQARLVPDWTSDLVIFANGHAVSGEDRADLDRRGIAVVEGPVARIVHDGGEMRAVVLEDGTAVAREALYVTTRSELASPLARDLGCAMAEGPTGPFVQVDAMQATSVPGVWAAGDMARAAYNAVWAAADGARAGVSCHQSLLLDEGARSAATPTPMATNAARAARRPEVVLGR